MGTPEARKVMNLTDRAYAAPRVVNLDSLPPRGSGAAQRILISVIERHPGCEIRVTLVRAPWQAEGRIAIGIWKLSQRDGVWRPEKRPWDGCGPALRIAEVGLVAAAMERAEERARELGWGTL